MVYSFPRSKTDILILHQIEKLTPPENRDIRDVFDGSRLTKPYRNIRSRDISKPSLNVRLPNLSE